MATRLAERSDCVQKHGCVIVRSGKVLSTGWNRYLNNVAYLPDNIAKRHASRHAEAHALRRVKNAKNVVLYVARISPGGNVLNSEPCGNCETLIKQYGVKRVVHT